MGECIVLCDREDFPLRASAHVNGAISPGLALWAGGRPMYKEDGVAGPRR